MAIAGVVVPFAAGYGSYVTPGRTSITALFVGAALVATSVGVTARVLADLGLLGRPAYPAVARQDGRDAGRLADLRTAPVSGMTFDGRVRALVVALAGDVAATARSADAADGLRVAALSARSAVTGVSLDEELVAVVQYQRSLEAASRAMTAIDEALNVLINRTGVVGR